MAYQADVYEGSPDGALIRSEALVTDAEGAALVTTQNGEERRRDFAAEAGGVPFVDMLHWPFEAAMRWQVANGGLQDGELVCVSPMQTVVEGMAVNPVFEG